MCTHITTTADIAGSGRTGSGWFPLNQVSVGYDHATQGVDEHALLLDFVNYDIGLGARLALELDLESGKALLSTLQSVIAQAEAAGLH
ncbi:DUF6295 family protein [Mycolicibacterium sp. XJ870]